MLSLDDLSRKPALRVEKAQLAAQNNPLVVGNFH